jgi:hypothetical protein
VNDYLLVASKEKETTINERIRLLLDARKLGPTDAFLDARGLCYALSASKTRSSRPSFISGKDALQKARETRTIRASSTSKGD